MAGGLEEVDRVSLEQRIHSFYDVYYSELRRRMSEYPAASGIFPYYLTGCRNIVATLAIDGVVVAHYPANHDSFEFTVNAGRRVLDLAEELTTLVYPDGSRVAFLAGDPANPGVDFDGAVQVMATEAEYNGQTIRPEHVRVDAAGINTLDTRIFDGGKAREDAEKYVTLSINAFVMGLTPIPADEQEGKVLAELGAAVDGYETLLAHDPKEWRVQMFLGLPRNKILLDPTAKSVTPEVRLGSEHRVDFVLELPQGRHVLVEIERPRDRLYTQDGDPADRHKHGQQQIMDWIEWLDEHKDYARKTIPALREVKEPEYWLVIGLRRDTSEEHQRRLIRKNAEMHRIKTMTFDDLLERAKQHLANLRSM